MALDEQRAHALVGASMAEIEEDCSRSWPQCPLDSVLCDCRLRAVQAVAVMKRLLAQDGDSGNG